MFHTSPLGSELTFSVILNVAYQLKVQNSISQKPEINLRQDHWDGY